MSLPRAVGALIIDTVRFGRATRRTSLVVFLIIGLVLVLFALTAQVVAPLALYPFA